MVKYSDVNKNDTVLEIGSGFGFLTRALSDMAGKVIAVELDTLLVAALKSELSDRDNIVIIEGNTLTTDLPEFDKIVSNPPYSISTPLFLKILDWCFDNAVLTLQKAFVKKLISQKGRKNYGKLAVRTYFKTNISVLEYVPKDSFFPRPKIDSLVIKIEPREPPFKIMDEDLFFDFINFAFTQRRKKLKNVIESFIQKRFSENITEIKTVHYTPLSELRIEELDPMEIGQITNIIFDTTIKNERN
jgi:16S rRNA (adenine1518-N6/adenine1519-N6)-dimethyltransferase